MGDDKAYYKNEEIQDYVGHLKAQRQESRSMTASHLHGRARCALAMNYTTWESLHVRKVLQSSNAVSRYSAELELLLFQVLLITIISLYLVVWQQ